MKHRKNALPQQSFTEVYVCDGYAAETLLNGNISHCVSYLKDLLECGLTGINAAYSELEKIKELVPDRYNFIKTSVFSYPKYSDFKQF